MAEYIEREAALKILTEYDRAHIKLKGKPISGIVCIAVEIEDIPAADVRPVVVCADCKHNNACLTQAFVEDESRVPFDRNTFFCVDGKRADDA